METENEWKRRIQKPIGVYVWSAIILIKFGILNFIGYFLAFRAADGEVYLPIVVISLGLCILTAAAAIWLIIGENEARITMMVLLPLNVLWIVLIAITALTNSEKIDGKDAVLAIIQQVILSLFVIGFEWYFMSQKVVEYYKQND